MGSSSSYFTERFDHIQLSDSILFNPLLDFQKRHPNSRKTFFYKKTRVEKYAPYSMKDGIVLKVSEFADYDCKSLSMEIQQSLPFQFQSKNLSTSHKDTNIVTINWKFVSMMFERIWSMKIIYPVELIS